MILSACSRHVQGKPVAVVSIPPQETLLKEIVGDSMDVFSMIRSDANPESFELSVADMRTVGNADAYISIGQLPFERSVLAKIRENNPGLEFFDASDGVGLIYGTHGHGGGGEDHECADPHIWSSIPNMRKIAANMLKAAKSIDPANADYYSRNYSRLDARLDSLDRALGRKTSGDSAAFLVWHPSLSYLARDYGLRQISLGAENKESSITQMKNNIETARDKGIRAFFVQSNYDPKQTENIIRELGLTPVGINPLDPDWEGQIKMIIDEIIR